VELSYTVAADVNAALGCPTQWQLTVGVVLAPAAVRSTESGLLGGVVPAEPDAWLAFGVSGFLLGKEEGLQLCRAWLVLHYQRGVGAIHELLWVTAVWSGLPYVQYNPLAEAGASNSLYSIPMLRQNRCANNRQANDDLLTHSR
jgi:hypothetical protein